MTHEESLIYVLKDMIRFAQHIDGCDGKPCTCMRDVNVIVAKAVLETSAKPYKCLLCGEEEFCNFIGGTLMHEKTLNTDDWRSIHNRFMGVFTPFVHRVIHNARQRNHETKKRRIR